MGLSASKPDTISQLIGEAFKSDRLRHHLSLHHSHDDLVQRVVIALVKGTYIPPHYHEMPRQWELFSIMHGNVDIYLFDHNGKVTDILTLGEASGNYFFTVEPNVCHTVICRSDYAVVMEVKEGPFNPKTAKVLPSWSHPENYDSSTRECILNYIGNLKIDDVFNSKDFLA